MNKSLIDLENIFVDIEIDTFEELIKKISEPLIRKSDVSTVFIDEVIKREEHFPTGLPTSPIGVAIPHTNAKFVNNNKVTIATLKKPIYMNIMGGMDEELIPVSIVFLLALGESNKQLNILQKLMSILNKEDILTRIKNGNIKSIYEIAKKEIEL